MNKYMVNAVINAINTMENLNRSDVLFTSIGEIIIGQSDSGLYYIDIDDAGHIQRLTGYETIISLKAELYGFFREPEVTSIEAQDEFWEYDEDADSWEYENGDIAADWLYDRRLYIRVSGMPLRVFCMSLEEAKKLIVMLINNRHDIYFLEDNKGMIAFRYMDEIPFDVADESGFGLVHATGRAILCNDGVWRDEYENWYTAELEEL